MSPFHSGHLAAAAIRVGKQCFVSTPLSSNSYIWCFTDTDALCTERKFLFWHWFGHHCDFPVPEKVDSRCRWPLLYSPCVSRGVQRTERNTSGGPCEPGVREKSIGKIVATYNRSFCTPHNRVVVRSFSFLCAPARRWLHDEQPPSSAWLCFVMLLRVHSIISPGHCSVQALLRNGSSEGLVQ